jgi:hypothetical protein
MASAFWRRAAQRSRKERKVGDLETGGFGEEGRRA